MSAVLAIDPGTEQSGWCRYDDGQIVASGVDANETLRSEMDAWLNEDVHLAVEMIASYGMPVGKEVFETCVWIGRFIEVWPQFSNTHLIYRRDVKLHLCGTVRAKDTNVRQALIDKLGPQGTKAKPGPLYGVKSHAWAALAVAVTFDEMMKPL